MGIDDRIIKMINSLNDQDISKQDIRNELKSSEKFVKFLCTMKEKTEKHSIFTGKYLVEINQKTYNVILDFDSSSITITVNNGEKRRISKFSKKEFLKRSYTVNNFKIDPEENFYSVFNEFMEDILSEGQFEENDRDYYISFKEMINEEFERKMIHTDNNEKRSYDKFSLNDILNFIQRVMYNNKIMKIDKKEKFVYNSLITHLFTIMKNTEDAREWEINHLGKSI
ncbi:hypothetical protein Bp8pS_304 [Bacillus phage vB_BpuM-BpSp]|nr:hypothetical protein Bp8pS_304 [Bacillus phage vB_BpuM-BpSp]